MAYQISTTSIQKLEHDITEIRIRALKYIEQKIIHGIKRNDIINFDSTNLMMKLINWLNFRPILELEIVLNLILMLFHTEYSKDIIKNLKINWLKSEFQKIYENLLKDDKSLGAQNKQILFNILAFLDQYKFPDDEDDEDLIDLTSIGDDECDVYSLDTNINDEYSTDYELAWSVPSISDHKSLKLLANSLSVDNSNDEVQHAFGYLKIAINDYPAEYFLQPPYIFKLIMKLKTNEHNVEQLLENLSYLTKSIKKRIESRKLSEYYIVSEESNSMNSKLQISVNRFCLEVFNLCMDCIKNSDDNWNMNEQLYLAYNLIYQIVGLLNDQTNLTLPLKAILADLGTLARFYRESYVRQEKENRLNRIQYVLIITLISRLISLINLKKKCINFNVNILTIKEVNNFDEIWYTELKYAMLDNTIYELYPQIYNEIENTLNMDDNSTEDLTLKTLLNCKNVFKPAIELLKDPHIHSKKNFIIIGMNAIDTLSIHKSLDLVKTLINSIAESLDKFDADENLKLKSENILLRLFAHENLIIRRLTYKECASKMKYCFGNLMNGKTSSNCINGKLQETKTFGFPLTVEILNEITCFGCNSTDLSIRTNAECIITLILKGQQILGEYWNRILEILQPIFPILQCIDAPSTNLNLVVNLFNPDNSTLSNCEILKTNLRFLYHSNTEIRSEALSRIIYILSQDAENKFLPNVLEITDTIPNDICILDVPRDINKIFYGGYYDTGTVLALLEMLRNQDLEPNIRKTTFTQLNVICQNPELNELFFNENGWYPAIQALENSMKQDYNMDYPDTSMPVIGIISKLLLHNPKFRSELSAEGSIYVLLIRALFLFHHDIALQQDCSLALFLLLFNSNIVGRINGLSMPKLFSSKLKIPFKCINWHWELSPYTKISPLEKIWISEIEEVSNKLRLSTDSSNPSLDYLSNNSDRPSTRKWIDKSSTCQSPKSQFIRLTFATEWFQSFREILKSFRQTKSNSHSIDVGLDYSIFPSKINESLGEVIEITEPYKFNRSLELTEIDLKTIKHSLISENIKNCLCKINNATTHDKMVSNISLIKLNLNLIQNNSEQKLPSGNILQAFRNYFVKQPADEVELLILNSIINLYASLINTGNDEIISIWILEELKEKNCIFLQLIRNYELSHKFCENLCELLKTLLKQCTKNLKNEKILKLLINEEINYNLYNNLFEQLIVITEECFHKRLLERVRSLLTILEILSESKCTELDSGFIQVVSKKLLYFIMNLESFYQAASNLNKNCLLIIGNLMMDTNEFILDANHIKFLAGFSSHFDLEIRALIWSIFEKLSRNSKGAELLVRELVYLPGGFHSCCLTVFLNSKEASIVRSTAGGVFSNLLTYTDSNGNLLQTIVPICIQEEPSENGICVIKDIMLKHQLWSPHILDNFFLSEFVVNNMSCKICTCSMIKSFCAILINYIDLNPSIIINELENEPIILKIFSLIKQVPSETIITKSSLEMINEICNLIIRFLNFKSKFIEKNLSRDTTFIMALFQLLNIELYDNLNLMKLTINNLEVLKMLSSMSKTIEIFSEILSSFSYGNLVNLLAVGFNINNRNIDFQISCLKFLTSLIIHDEIYCLVKKPLNDNEHKNFISISKIFNETNVLDSYNKFTKKFKNYQLKSNYNIENIDCKYGGEILFLTLHELLVSVCFKNNNHISDLRKKIYVFEATATLLKSSKGSRIIANKINLLKTVLKSIRFVLEQIKISCTDFIRKYGETKKNPIVKELELHYNIILHWYSADSLTNESDILELSKLFLQTWPWMMHSESLKRTCIKTLVFLSEDSLKVCKQFSTSITNYSNSILQLTIKLVLCETTKVKHPQIDFKTLKLGLRILSNCCSCIEGRNVVDKLNVLEVFDRFHPSITKLQQVWNNLTILWLEFWEIFSRHPEGATQKFLVLLCTIIAKGNSTMRLLSLTIIRNMAFLNNNRIGLLNSSDLQYTINSILTTGQKNEQILITTTIWQLIADNYKAKYIIRGTLIPKKLKIILEQINDTDPDLIQNIEIILKILKT